MKKIICYTTTALVISCGMSQAQTCVPTPDCQTLGYTSSSYCSGGLKCPFGNYWNCDAVNCELSGKVTELTEKIVELEKKIDQQQQQESCVVGSILYLDMTCSVTVTGGKTPIGIVVYIDGTGGGQALALKSIGSYDWSSESGDNISGLTNYSSSSAASKDYDSCGNTAKIIAAGDKSEYPAAWAAHEYKTAGTEAGDWCLPAAGIFTSYYNNQDAINTGFRRAGGTQFTNSTYAWSSSESSYYDGAWYSSFSWSYGLDDYRKYDYDREVRPVLEF